LSRRKKAASHPSHDRWLVSYADFITLLFAFFVVLFASSQVDKRKVGQLALAIQVAFQRLGMFTPSGANPSVATTEVPFAKAQMIDSTAYTEDLGRIVPSNSGELTADVGIQHPDRIREQLQDALASQIRNQQVSVHFSREGLVISLREVGFYESGSATLMSSALPILAKIANILLPRDEFIRVEGHTDNVPIHNSAFGSNWQLSTARAANMIELLVTRFGFAPYRLSAAGYAEYHPAATNDTPEGRAENRRVDIVVLNPALWGLASGRASAADSRPSGSAVSFGLTRPSSSFSRPTP
jgi:chemotaxis protein MotB